MRKVMAGDKIKSEVGSCSAVDHKIKSEVVFSTINSLSLC